MKGQGFFLVFGDWKKTKKNKKCGGWWVRQEDIIVTRKPMIFVAMFVDRYLFLVFLLSMFGFFFWIMVVLCLICLFLLRFLFFWFLNFVTGFWFCGYVCLIHGVTWKKGWILEVWAVLEVGEQKPFTLVVFFMQLFLCFSSLVLCSSLESKDHIPPFFSVFVNLGSRFCISIVEVVKSYQILSLVYMFFFFSPKAVGNLVA